MQKYASNREIVKLFDAKLQVFYFASVQKMATEFMKLV